MLDATCLWPGCGRTEIYARGLCSRCNMRARRAGRLAEFEAPPRTCGNCGISFRTGSQGGNIYCSFACQRTAVRKRAEADRIAEMADRSCERCTMALPLSARSDARYCTVACQQASWYDANEERLRAAATAWRLSNHEARSEAHHRRRARKLGTPCGEIDRAAVWLRDEGRCWICDGEVDAALAYPERMSASLDHVIPLSQGGGHVMENVALAHLRCNISKKDKILDRVPRWAQAEVMSDVVAWPSP